MHILLLSDIHVASRRQPPAPHRISSERSTLLMMSAIVLFYCRRSATGTPVRPPRFERCCSHTFATARNCQWCRPLKPKTSESTGCRKKNAKNLVAMYSGPTQFKKERKTWKNGEIAVIYSVFARWEAETTANTLVLEGQVAKNSVIYSVFLTNVKKHWYLRCFHSHRNIKQRNLRGFWKFWS